MPIELRFGQLEGKDLTEIGEGVNLSDGQKIRISM